MNVFAKGRECFGVIEAGVEYAIDVYFVPKSEFGVDVVIPLRQVFLVKGDDYQRPPVDVCDRIATLMFNYFQFNGYAVELRR